VAVAPVQGKAASNAASAAPTITTTSNVAVGDVVLLAIRVNNTTTTISSVTDSLGNTWTVAIAQFNASTGFSLALYYSQITTGGACTITVNLSVSTGTRFAVEEYSGMVASGTLIEGTPSTGIGTGVTLDSGATTTSTASDTLIGIGGGNTATGISQQTSPAGWVTRQQSSGGLELGDNIGIGAGSYNHQPVIGNSQAWAAGIAGFLAAAATTPSGTEAGTLSEGAVNVALAGPSEAVGLADAVATALARSDTGVVVDVVALALAIQDSAALVESITIALSSNDAGVIAEAAQNALVGTEAVTFGEAATISVPKVSSDATVLGELVANALASVDAATVVESVSIAVAAAATQSAIFVDQVTLALATGDTATLGDLAALAMAVSAESATVGESAAISSATAATETGTVGEAASVNTGTTPISASQAVTLTDAAVLAVSPAAVDTVALSEAIAITAQRTAADSAVLAEQINIALNATQGVGLAESAARALVFGDQAALADIISVAVAIAAAQPISVGEQAAAAASLAQKTATQPVTLTEAVRILAVGNPLAGTALYVLGPHPGTALSSGVHADADTRSAIFGQAIYGLAVFGVSTSGATSMMRVSRSGASIVNSDGSVFVPRGVNLGNWLHHEGYLMGGGTSISHSRFLAGLVDLVGQSAVDAWVPQFIANWITLSDFQAMADMGFNVVRLPINYRLLEDDSAPGVYKASGWSYLDNAVNMAQAVGIHVLLDLHSAPGGQSGFTPADPGPVLLWADTALQDRTVALWTAIAARYASRDCIFGYDLLNEPQPGNGTASIVATFYQRLATAIRAVDPTHMLVCEPLILSGDLAPLTATVTDSNVCYSTHLYQFGQSDTRASRLASWHTSAAAASRPLWVGEWGENTVQWDIDTRAMLENPANDVEGWAFWTWKRAQTSVPNLNVVVPPDNWKYVVSWITTPGLLIRPSASYTTAAMADFLTTLQGGAVPDSGLTTALRLSAPLPPVAGSALSIAAPARGMAMVA
jgi:endoglucanase